MWEAPSAEGGGKHITVSNAEYLLSLEATKCSSRPKEPATTAARNIAIRLIKHFHLKNLKPGSMTAAQVLSPPRQSIFLSLTHTYPLS